MSGIYSAHSNSVFSNAIQWCTTTDPYSCHCGWASKCKWATMCEWATMLHLCLHVISHYSCEKIKMAESRSVVMHHWIEFRKYTENSFRSSIFVSSVYVRNLHIYRTRQIARGKKKKMSDICCEWPFSPPKQLFGNAEATKIILNPRFLECFINYVCTTINIKIKWWFQCYS